MHVCPPELLLVARYMQQLNILHINTYTMESRRAHDLESELLAMICVAIN